MNTSNRLDFLTSETFSDASGEDEDDEHVLSSFENSYNNNNSKNNTTHCIDELATITISENNNREEDDDIDLSQINLNSNLNNLDFKQQQHQESLRIPLKTYDCVFFNKQLNLVFKIDHESKVVRVINTSNNDEDDDSHNYLLELGHNNSNNDNDIINEVNTTLSDGHNEKLLISLNSNELAEQINGYLYLFHFD